MAYRVVYDLLDDSWVYVPGALAAFCFLCVAFMWRHRRNHRGVVEGTASFTILSPGLISHRPAWRSTAGQPAPLLHVATFGIIGLCLVNVEYNAVADQWQSKEWLRAGQYDTVEGVIADCRPSRNGGAHRFRVQEIVFVCDKAGGFRGTFTAPDAPPSAEALRNGARVRVTHREGRVLRIEIPA